AGGGPQGQGGRRATPGRAAPIPSGRSRRGVHPVLLPRRHLRLRRRAQRRLVNAAQPGSTRMYREAAEAPAVVRAQLRTNAARLARLAERLRQTPPRAVVTCARGSSDHAATFARYLIETRLGLLTSSAAPSVSSVYEAQPDLAGTLVLVISQSGARPDLLARAWELDWSAALTRLTHATNLYVIGRGPGLAIAQEAALKFKETCGLHAEAVSAAELRHGPIALVRPGFPLLVFAQNDESRAGVAELSGELAAQGADVLLAGAQAPHATLLPTEAAHPVIEPLLLVQSFYRMVNALALARGGDP